MDEDQSSIRESATILAKRSPKHPKEVAQKQFVRKLRSLASATAHSQDGSKESGRLTTRGLVGSMEFELEDFEVPHPEHTFAFVVRDHTLDAIGLHRGNVVVIAPVLHKLREGDVVLAHMDGSENLFRVVADRQIMYLECGENAGRGRVLVQDHPPIGIVAGVLRFQTVVEPFQNRSGSRVGGYAESPSRLKPKRKFLYPLLARRPLLDNNLLTDG